MDEFIKETEDTDTLNSLRYAVESGRLQVDTEELPEETDATEPELSVPEEMLDEVVSKTEDTDVLHRDVYKRQVQPWLRRHLL